MNNLLIAGGIAVLFAIASIVTMIINAVVHPQNNPTDSVTMTSMNLLNTYSVDNRYFYQGLEYIDETHLLMSEGWYGTSALAILDIDNS